jgi:hypothetical protein
LHLDISKRLRIGCRAGRNSGGEYIEPSRSNTGALQAGATAWSFLMDYYRSRNAAILDGMLMCSAEIKDNGSTLTNRQTPWNLII